MSAVKQIFFPNDGIWKYGTYILASLLLQLFLLFRTTGFMGRLEYSDSVINYVDYEVDSQILFIFKNEMANFPMTFKSIKELFTRLPVHGIQSWKSLQLNGLPGYLLKEVPLFSFGGFTLESFANWLDIDPVQHQQIKEFSEKKGLYSLGDLHRLANLNNIYSKARKMEPQLSERMNTRIEYLSSLPNGWYDTDKGIKIDRIAMEATKILLGYSSNILPEPSLFPVQDGSISVEWQNIDPPITVDVHVDHYDLALFMNGRVDSREYAFIEIDQLAKMMKRLVTKSY